MRNAFATLLLVLTGSAAVQTFEQSTSLRLSKTPMSARDIAYDDADAPAMRRTLVGISYGFGR